MSPDKYLVCLQKRMLFLQKRMFLKTKWLSISQLTIYFFLCGYNEKQIIAEA